MISALSNMTRMLKTDGLPQRRGLQAENGRDRKIKTESPETTSQRLLDADKEQGNWLTVGILPWRQNNHSGPACPPFSATERFINNTANVTTNVNTAAIQKTSK